MVSMVNVVRVKLSKARAACSPLIHAIAAAPSLVAAVCGMEQLLHTDLSKTNVSVSISLIPFIYMVFPSHA